MKTAKIVNYLKQTPNVYLCDVSKIKSVSFLVNELLGLYSFLQLRLCYHTGVISCHDNKFTAETL